MAEQLFTTDGFRGPVDYTGQANTVSAENFRLLANSFTHTIRNSGQNPIVVVGSDTRESSNVLRDAACEGIADAGGEVWDMGIAPTPVIGWAAQRYGIHGVAITASHNVYTDNGIKLFAQGGVKANRATLDEVELGYQELLKLEKIPHTPFGRITEVGDVVKDTYLKHLIDKFGEGSLDGKRMVIDGANGAAYDLAPRLYRALGAEVITFACDNNGRAINDNCGAAHLEGVQAFQRARPEILEDDNFLGITSNDGDTDRVMWVDSKGRVINGNHMMGRLAVGQNGIVGTLYTNSALTKNLQERGIEFYQCDNGDSYVTAMLQQLTAEKGSGYTRGGEFTGHLIDLNHLPSGDGLYMGALMATDLARNDMTLVDVYDELTLWPEQMVNLQLGGANAKEIVARDQVQDAIARETERLGGFGRVIVRGSGTEPVVRLWVEAKNKAEMARTINILQNVITNQLVCK